MAPAAAPESSADTEPQVNIFNLYNSDLKFEIKYTDKLSSLIDNILQTAVTSFEATASVKITLTYYDDNNATTFTCIDASGLENNTYYDFVIFAGTLNNTDTIATIQNLNVVSSYTHDNNSTTINNNTETLFLAIFSSTTEMERNHNYYSTFFSKSIAAKDNDTTVKLQLKKIVTLKNSATNNVTIYNQYNSKMDLTLGAITYDISNNEGTSSIINGKEPEFYIKFDINTQLKFYYKNAFETTIGGLDGNKKYVFILFSGLPPNTGTVDISTITVDAISGKIGDADIKSGVKKLYLAIFSVGTIKYVENDYSKFLYKSSLLQTSQVSDMSNNLVKLVPLDFFTNVTIYNMFNYYINFKLNSVAYNVLNANSISSFANGNPAKISFKYKTSDMNFEYIKDDINIGGSTINALNNETKYVAIIILGSGINYMYDNILDYKFLIDRDNSDKKSNLNVLLFLEGAFGESDYNIFINQTSVQRGSNPIKDSFIELIKLVA